MITVQNELRNQYEKESIEWLTAHGCSREAAKAWHERTMLLIHGDTASQIVVSSNLKEKIK